MSDDLFGPCNAKPPSDLVCGRPKFHAGPCGEWHRIGVAPDPARDAPGMARTDHPPTAHRAAYRAFPRTGTQRRKVLEAVARHGCTDEEMQQGLAMNPNSQRPRRRELVLGGWIEDSGATRGTQGGDDAIIWRLARPLP